MLNKKGFTLIELLIVIAIISLLAVAIFSLIINSRAKARVNSVKRTMRTTLPAIVACKYENGSVNHPAANVNICMSPVGLNGAKWPELNSGYDYGPGTYDSSNCSFQITTSDIDIGYLTCDCIKQNCE